LKTSDVDVCLRQLKVGVPTLFELHLVRFALLPFCPPRRLAIEQVRRRWWQRRRDTSLLNRLLLLLLLLLLLNKRSRHRRRRRDRRRCPCLCRTNTIATVGRQ
jgi:hypothetical protein